jgi:hypothetical protein
MTTAVLLSMADVAPRKALLGEESSRHEAKPVGE